ncbi:translation initiation factor eIF3d Moe1 [Sugiyamaella lignohabitans]|uniref:Eukaryotic translation initiation factor 3 subunit D n=1 Tax=Sugiyamaella lignohabitans TaxID=796027 RepID=A0A167EUE0_9ASCO|nr:translation initiation factor eIF3d Moe1 [Sugiyamaella lignohabitans]ANB14468.1 translation initiation factor eIF3d Moe1 [Sugiyamaella lignohabitans]
MSAPRLPKLASTSEPWGPPSEVPTSLRFNNVPYAPYSKGDKLGKAADWAFDAGKDGKDQKRQQYGRGFRDPYHAYGSNFTSFFTNEEDEGITSFSVVDSAAKAAPKNAGGRGGSQHTILKSRRGGAGAAGGRGGSFQSQRGHHQGQGRGGQGGGRGQGFKRPGWRDYDKPQKVRDASVNITEGWSLIQSIGFNEFQKLSFDVRQGESIDSYGSVHYYNNKTLDKPSVNAKLEPLDRIVYNISTSDDPVIQELSAKDAGTVFATDSIISLLMCVTKTVNPWDIIITKKNGKVYLDKREGGPLDLVSVDENAADAPADATDSKDTLNNATALAYEATYINQNFNANAVIESSETYDFGKPNPFYSEEDQKQSEPLLAHGYDYKKFNLANNVEEEPINLVIRTEIDAAQKNLNGSVSLVTVKALNEYGGSTGALEWKNRFVNARGAIVAAEMKNNLCKISRWTVQSILAGANLMKIGFVSRVNPKDNTQHTIIGVIGQEPAQLSNQINLNLNNGWGIVKSVVNICSELDEGKYVLLRDPNNPAVKLYKVPSNAFEE